MRESQRGLPHPPDPLSNLARGSRERRIEGLRGSAWIKWRQVFGEGMNEGIAEGLPHPLTSSPFGEGE